MKLSILLILVVSCFVVQPLEAQSKKKLYYSGHWEITTQDSAYYYRVCALDTVKYQFVGDVTDYLLNHQIVMKGSYTNGQKNGEFILYYPNGQIESQGDFKDDKRSGVWKYYFPNGKIQREVSFTGDEFFVKALYGANEKVLIQDGTGDWYYKYEWQNLPYKLVVTGRFVAGKKEGEWRCFTSNGELVYIENFKENKLQDGMLFSDGKKTKYEAEFPNKFLPPFKFESTEKFLYSDFVKRADYTFFKFLPVILKNGEDPVFTIVEEQASFVGGFGAIAKFVAKNLKYPPEARRMGIQGSVFVSFIINKDGSISNLKVVKGIGGGCDEEAIRVVSIFPPWNPGKQNGKIVRSRFVIPIKFK